MLGDVYFFLIKNFYEFIMIGSDCPRLLQSLKLRNTI